MLNRFISSLPPGVDGALIVSPENRRYFTGFESSDGFLLATRRGSVFLTDSRYIEEAANKVKSCEVRELRGGLAAVCSEFDCKALAVEADRLTVSQLRSLRKALKGIRLTTVGTDKLIDRLRAVKNSGEVADILRAQSVAEAAFEHILGFIHTGVTEKEIALELNFFMLSHGADDLSFETIAISGANTSKPHGVPTDKRVKDGDFVTMDYGAAVNGYRSDMTRTVAVGKVSEEQQTIYNIVLQAQLAALDVLKAGVDCREADRAAREIIAQAGYGDYYRHGTGHGVGIEIHEKPSLSPKSDEKLQVGNVVTVEPGIYIPGKFGVRIEDMAVITENGCENLTKISKKLIII